MTKVIKKKASRVGYKAMKKRNQNRTRNMMVISQDLSDAFSIDPDAVYLMELVEGKVSPELLELLNSMLLGFCEDIQFEMANDLLDFANHHIIHKTGCLSVDSILGACYIWIAEEQGIDKEEILKLISNRKND